MCGLLGIAIPVEEEGLMEAILALLGMRSLLLAVLFLRSFLLLVGLCLGVLV